MLRFLMVPSFILGFSVLASGMSFDQRDHPKIDHNTMDEGDLSEETLLVFFKRIQDFQESFKKKMALSPNGNPLFSGHFKPSSLKTNKKISSNSSLSSVLLVSSPPIDCLSAQSSGQTDVFPSHQANVIPYRKLKGEKIPYHIVNREREEKERSSALLLRGQLIKTRGERDYEDRG